MKRKTSIELENSFVTLEDVAKLAKVSTATVSRVYSPKWKGKIKDSTIKKVLDAANELGYTPNGIARSLVIKKTNIIAVVMGVSPGYFYQEVLKKIINAIQDSGRQALVFVADPTKGVEQVVAQVLQHRVDGIIITASAIHSDIVNYFNNSNIPVVLFNRTVKNSDASCIWGDGRKAASEVADFLVNNKYRKFGYISGYAQMDRNEGFINRLKHHSVLPAHIYKGDYSYQSGYKGAIEMLTSNNPPEAIFCESDTMAMGAIDAARLELNLDIPNDISIVGFDNLSMAKLPIYDLTTVDYPVNEMIDSLIDAVNQLLQQPKKQILKKFDLNLIIRSTVKIQNK